MKKNLGNDLIMTPMPVLIIGTYDENGVPNAMNAAWGTQCDMDSITIFLSKHKTTDNLQIKRAFTVAFATKDTLKESDYFGVETGRNINKIERAGFHAVKSQHVDAPVITEYPVTLECEMVELADDGGEHRLIGRVVNVIADESVLTENGKIDLGKMGAISYDSALHAYRVIGDVVGTAFHDGLVIKNN
ncbi:MAG: flavin reductase family protein [Alphaproteobacteria bacterium]|nr:flavin reductase family protein [Alphaproteobacteria bacterium]